MHLRPPDPKLVLDDVLDATVLLSYTDLGPRIRRRLFDWEPLDAMDMAGTTVVLTGATSGLGMTVATEMASMGAALRLLVRDLGRGEQVRTRIHARNPGADVDLIPVDMSDLSSVRDAVDRLRSQEHRIDVLINNAGGISAERRLSIDGNERSFATMVLGPFALTNGLEPLLERGPDARRSRVINVVSGGMYTQGLHLDDVQMEHEPYRGSVAYARAKRALVVLTQEWAWRWRERGVVVHAMHPGWADTPGIAAALPRFRSLLGPRLRSAEDGADTIVWLAASDEAAVTTGRLWLDRRPRPTVRLPGTSSSREDRDHLWELCERLTARRSA